MATIKAIEARTVHQIQSGQVIVDLCSVVKELVENSVDAGATNIEVRFKNQGLDLIEVQDNGAGISPENYETLALKHYTSKLSTYEDLTSLQTFGFRGEALSSLCALSKFSVTTCLASDAPKGSKLEFETSGKLRGTAVVAAQKGTTMTIEGLFNNLPVRRRELERNIKKEWNRVIGVLNQYACILTGVKFSVSQQPNKGKKIVLFSTKGNSTTRENIVNVFGAKTLTVLIPLQLELELEPTSGPSQHRNTRGDEDSTKEVKIKGHVSRPAHGEGRQTPDRQMFFVNGRPCGLPQFAKAFNEVYKSYNSSQSPFIFADIQLDTHMYDVNVSPDKRTILLHDQSRLLDNLRESLIALFEAQDYSVPQSQLGGPKQTPFRKLTMSRQSTIESDKTSTRSPSVGVQGAVKTGQTGPRSAAETTGDQDVEDAEENDDVALGGSNMLGESPAGTYQATELMSRWLDKKSDARADSTTKVSPPAPNNRQGELSRSKERLVSRFSHADQDAENEDDVDDDADTDATETSLPTNRAPSRVADFNAHMAELNESTRASAGEGEDQGSCTAEPRIPSISTPSRTSDMRTMKLSPRFKRTAPEVATITIGNDTVTSVIGSPAKRMRTETPREKGSTGQHTASKETAPIPSFQGRLTQMFSASSTSRGRGEKVEIITGLVDGPHRSRSPSEESEGLFVQNASDLDEVDESGGSNDAGSPFRQELTQDADEEADSHMLTSPVDEEVVMDDANESGTPAPSEHSDGEYIDEDDKKAQEEDKVREMIDAAEDATKATSEEMQKRQQSFVKGLMKRKDGTRQLLQRVRLDEDIIRSSSASLADSLTKSTASTTTDFPEDNLDADDAEEKLSLTISKTDFGKMKIVGQFNLGFILAVRPAEANPDDANDRHAMDDELFIIDQHATDEKYNFERLQATTVVQSQRLVQPKALELTAIEEEVIKENIEALENNGFMVSIDESGYQPVGSRCQLLSLPLSRETTFTLADLEELISLLTDHQSTSANTIPRPSKVRKMFAMRACRSSVMIGKSLANKQMEKLVRHMGELDKPWNCPHGRPTMRHLCGLGAWNESIWQEGDGLGGEEGRPTNWAAYLRDNRDT
ncbi:hypothetical protein JX266_001791 [Neoarthrinium moseri]|nr:hypothetical protein JX266_001791 [Neoarthrinium moseri]